MKLFMKENLIPPPSNAFDAYTKAILERIARIKKHLSESKETFEKSILRYQSIEDLALPLLRSHVLHQLGASELQNKFDSQKNSSHLIYLALTQDVELYSLLEKARKLRNEIVHEICKDPELKHLKKAKTITKLTNQIIEEIALRFEGKKVIPVLELYKKGWKDASIKIRDAILAKRDELK